MSYAIFFSSEDMTVRIPTNPEELTVSENQEIKEFDILKLGKIAVPAGMALRQFSFEAEFPSKIYPYVLTEKGFRDAKFYIDHFRKWREEKKPIRFIVYSENVKLSELVLIKSLNIKEKAGEEGDYLISFNLSEYRPYAMKKVQLEKKTSKSKSTSSTKKEVYRQAEPPRPENEIYTIVQGDTLWAIAKKYLGDGSRYPEIHKLNCPPLSKDPDVIYPDQKIRIPKR